MKAGLNPEEEVRRYPRTDLIPFDTAHRFMATLHHSHQGDALIFLKGAPEKMFEDTIAFANITNGTGSLVLTDDLETYGRIGVGVTSEGAEWIEIGRGYTTDRPDDHGGVQGSDSTSEVYIRNMYDSWLAYMQAA